MTFTEMLFFYGTKWFFIGVLPYAVSSSVIILEANYIMWCLYGARVQIFGLEYHTQVCTQSTVITVREEICGHY